MSCVSSQKWGLLDPGDCIVLEHDGRERIALVTGPHFGTKLPVRLRKIKGGGFTAAQVRVERDQCKGIQRSRRLGIDVKATHHYNGRRVPPRSAAYEGGS